MNLGRRKITTKSYYFVALFLASLVAVTFHLTGNTGCVRKALQTEEETVVKVEQIAYVEEGIARNDSVPECNLFSGRWIFDNISYPLYKEAQCSLLPGKFACQRSGRKDVKYQNWRWQPHHCDLPRFDGRALLEKIRGKRLVYVGDSLNRNQWTSMLCLLESSVDKSADKSVIRNGNSLIFKATEYNATIEFYWSPLLVESNCDDLIDHQITDRIVRITAIENHSRNWSDADILIFDSFVWWLPETMTFLWGSFGSSDAIYRKVDNRLRRYEMALNTWSDWLEFNINPTKTNLFFMSLSPYHTHGESWSIEQNCYNESEPIMKEGYWGVATDRGMMQIAESVLQKLETRGLKIEYLNITQLSDYRLDAHPSIYKTFYHPRSEKELANPKSYADCFHWCLPGVPDVWNELLYASIMKSS